MFNRLTNYIDSKDLELNYKNNGIYVINYNKIYSYTSNKIVISNISIIGSNLLINILKKDELYITGNIYEIKFI